MTNCSQQNRPSSLHRETEGCCLVVEHRAWVSEQVGEGAIRENFLGEVAS